MPVRERRLRSTTSPDGSDPRQQRDDDPNGHGSKPTRSLNRTGFFGDLIAWEDGVYGTGSRGGVRGGGGCLEMARRKGTFWQREKGPLCRDGCLSTRFLLSSVGRLVPLGGLEAVAVPVGRQHGGMVHDAVDDGRGGGRIQEHLGPAGERQSGRHDQAPALVAAADEAEQQVGAGLVERHVAERVNDDHVAVS